MAKAYERIADELRQSIRTGRLKPGDQLPAETRLAEQSGRSVPTVRDALRLLQAEGLIEKVHGRGNFVRRARTAVQRTNARHQWEKDRARQPHEKRAQTGATEHDTGLDVGDLVFRAAYREIAADEDIAAAMGVALGTVLVERTYRTRYSAERAPSPWSRPTWSASGSRATPTSWTRPTNPGPAARGTSSTPSASRSTASRNACAPVRRQPRRRRSWTCRPGQRSWCSARRWSTPKASSPRCRTSRSPVTVRKRSSRLTWKGGEP